MAVESTICDSRRPTYMHRFLDKIVTYVSTVMLEGYLFFFSLVHKESVVKYYFCTVCVPYTESDFLQYAILVHEMEFGNT